MDHRKLEFNKVPGYKIWGLLTGVDEDPGLLGCYAMTRKTAGPWSGDVMLLWIIGNFYQLAWCNILLDWIFRLPGCCGLQNRWPSLTQIILLYLIWYSITPAVDSASQNNKETRLCKLPGIPCDTTGLCFLKMWVYHAASFPIDWHVIKWDLFQNL